MEKDIILDGIIKYTKDKKVNWMIFYDGEYTTEYRCNIKIQGNKYINIEFSYDFKNINSSIIRIYISKGSYNLSSPVEYKKKYIDIDSNGRTARLKELVDIITGKKIKV
jgi:hypothetical protein